MRAAGHGVQTGLGERSALSPSISLTQSVDRHVSVQSFQKPFSAVPPVSESFQLHCFRSRLFCTSTALAEAYSKFYSTARKSSCWSDTQDVRKAAMSHEDEKKSGALLNGEIT